MPKNFDSRGAYKRHKLDLMDDYLRSLGLKRKPLPKDGCCIFRAVSEQLFFSQNYHYSIRQACVRYMKKNRDVYESLTEVCFDEYLGRLTHSKEWADQLEMGALSKMYKCDFLIYMHPGQATKNVTDNGFDKKVHLCHSGQQQYDSVYSFNYFRAHAMCQSIVFEILFERVLGFEKSEKSKLVNTYRMLSFPSATTDKEGAVEKVPFHDQIPRNSVLSPCIGTLSKDKPITEQLGLGYKLPISLDFIRGLDPFIFRNIDYDWWIIVKRKPQYIDFSISEGMHFYIGDRCRISLSPFSKPLLGHVQEISPSNGPITCFIEALGELLTIAAANATRLEPEHCKPSAYRSRRKFRDSEAFRQGGNGGGGRRWLSRPPRPSDQDGLNEGGGGNGNDQSLANGINNCNIGYENGHKGNNYHLRNGQPPLRKISEGHWSPHRKPNKFQQQSEDYDVGGGRRRQTSKNWRNIPLQPGDNQQEYYSNDGGGEWWWGDKTSAAATYEQLPATHATDTTEHDDGGHTSRKNHHPPGDGGRLYPTSRHQSDKHNRNYDVSGCGGGREVCWNMEGGDKENQINENSELQKCEDNQGVHTGNDHFTNQQNDGGQQDTNFQQQDHHGGIHNNEEMYEDCSDQPPVIDENDQHAAAPYTVRAVGPNEWVSYVPAYGYTPQNYTVEGGGVEDGRVDGGGYYTTTEDRTPYNYFYNLGVEYYRMIANNGNGGSSNGQGNQLAPATPLILAPAPINHHNNPTAAAAAATSLYSTTPLVQPSTPHLSFPSPTALNCIPASNPPMAPNQAATPHHATMPYVATSSQYHSPIHPTSANIMQNQSVTRFYFPVAQQTPSIAVAAAPLQYQSVIVQHPATDEDSSNDSTNVAGGNYMITAAEMNGNLQQYPSYQVEGGYAAPHNTTILQHASNNEATNYIAMAPTTYYHQPPQYYQATSDQGVATIPPVASSSNAPVATCQ